MKCSANDNRISKYVPTVSENGFHFVSLLVCLFALIVLIPSALFGFRPISRFRPRFLWLSDEEKGRKSLPFEHDEFTCSLSIDACENLSNIAFVFVGPFHSRGLTRDPREDGEKIRPLARDVGSL